MHDVVENPDGIAYAHAALEQVENGDRHAALPLIAAALSFEPHQADWLELADRLLSDAEWAHSELTPRPGLFFALVALRARLLMTEGAWTEAVAALLEVAVFRCDVDYLRWVPLTPEVLGSLELSRVGPLLATFVKGSEALSQDDPRRATYASVVALIDGLRAVHPRVSQLAHFEGVLLRRLGNFDAAVALAERELERAPSWAVAIAAGNALKEAGNVARARVHFIRALELDPSKWITHLDVADLDFDAERFEDAAAHYERVLQAEPAHEWALPSWLYCRARLGEAGAQMGLRELAQSASASERARTLARRMK